MVRVHRSLAVGFVLASLLFLLSSNVFAAYNPIFDECGNSWLNCGGGPFNTAFGLLFLLGLGVMIGWRAPVYFLLLLLCIPGVPTFAAAAYVAFSNGNDEKGWTCLFLCAACAAWLKFVWFGGIEKNTCDSTPESTKTLDKTPNPSRPIDSSPKQNSLSNAQSTNPMEVQNTNADDAVARPAVVFPWKTGSAADGRVYMKFCKICSTRVAQGDEYCKKCIDSGKV